MSGSRPYEARHRTCSVEFLDRSVRGSTRLCVPSVTPRMGTRITCGDPTEHVKWWRIDIAKAWGVDWIVRAALQNELG